MEFEYNIDNVQYVMFVTYVYTHHKENLLKKSFKQLRQNKGIHQTKHVSFHHIPVTK